MFFTYAVQNFKTHRESEAFKINGLTILTGTNNSGKSSIIQSLRLLSLINDNSLPGFTRLPFEKVVGLKSFKDTLNITVDSKEAIKFDFDCDIEGFTYCNVILEFDSTVYHQFKEFKAKSETVLRVMKIIFQRNNETPKTIRFEICENPDELYYMVDGYVTNKFIRFNGLVPDFNFFNPGYSKIQNKVFNEISNDKDLLDIFRFISNISPNRVKYLNANRVIQRLSLAESTNYLIEHGENTANIIHLLRDQNVLDGKNTFKELFNEWTKKLLDTTFEIKVENAIPRIVAIQDTYEFELEQIGFGNTQILPLITLILSSEKGDLLLIETPEEQLHPKWRANLVELFYFAVQKGITLIIETHSLEIINRIRLRIKNEKELSNYTSIYFLHREGFESVAQRISIEDTGRLSCWPDDFLDKVTVEDSFNLLRP